MNRLFIILLFATTFSQSQISSADLNGTVVDGEGAVVPGAVVTLTSIDTGLQRQTASAADGGWRFFLLPPDAYEVQVKAAGFAIYTRRPVQLTVGGTVALHVTLQPASLQTEILVQEDTPIVETQKIQQSDTITEERIQNLPINERNFLNFSLLTPGVTDSKGLATFSLPQAPASGLSFMGQNGRSNSITIDGADNNDNAVAGVRSTLSQEAVQEFQINRSNYSAEFGRASGGLINIVSKSGTNNWHGNVFAFLRDQRWDARNPFSFGENGSSIDPPYSRQQAGFTLGGPIRRDQSFFFLSYEGLRQRESQFVTFLENTSFFQPTAVQRGLIAPLLNSPLGTPSQLNGQRLLDVLTTSASTYPDTLKLLRDNSGAFPYRNNDNTASVRFDHSLTSSNRLFGRLTFSDIDTTGALFGGLRAPSRAANYKIQDAAGVFADSHFFSSNLVNEFRFQFANRNYAALPADGIGPEITINGVAALGRDFFLPSTRVEKRYQWVDNVTMASGKHELKFGGDFNDLPFDTRTEVFIGGRFIFGDGVPNSVVLGPGAPGTLTPIQAFNLGLPIAYQQGFGNPEAKLGNKLLSAYVQDSFHAADNLSFNFGLRYDMEFQPSPVHRDANNFAPRVGFSYSPNNRTVFRGGYGIYYAPIYEAVAFVGRVLNGQQISQVFIPLSGLPQLGINATSAQVWGLVKQKGILGTRTITKEDIAPLGIAPGTTPPVLLTADQGIVNPYSQQFSLGFDREIAGVNISANYQGNHGVKLIRSRNINLKQIGTNAYGPAFGPIDPRILQDNRIESSGGSIYHGMTLSATKRFARYYQFEAAYTLSKAIDDTTDFITDLQAANQLDLRGERGLSTFDQRHRFVFSGVFQSPFQRGIGMGRVLAGMTVAPVYTWSSGHPFNVLLGFDANGDTQANTDRPSGLGRNVGRGPNFSSLDLRIAKEFFIPGDNATRVEAIFETFNLFNSVNFSGVNNIVGTSALPSGEIHGQASASPTQPLGFTSAFDPRQIQLGLKFKF